ncbi:MAG: AAA family ATPase [Leptospiraceae bacterium]|nr:AAA family ATPase [Leptospiraceae bacterium]
MNQVEIAGIKVPILGNKQNAKIFPTSIVETPTTKRNLQNILYPLLDGSPVLLVGDAGVGKNALIYYINEKRNMPTVRFSFNEDTLPEDLIGSYRLLMNGTGFEWVNGPIVSAMEKGFSFVADEMNLASPSVIKRFSTVYESSFIDLIEANGERKKAKEGFSFIATQNPSEGFEGRKSLSYEITKNFAVVYVESYPPEEIYFILKNLFPELSESLLQSIIKINMETEKKILMGTLGKNDLEKYHFNLRTLKKLCSRLLQYDCNQKSVLREHVMSFYVDLFRNPEDRKSQEDFVLSELSLKEEYVSDSVKLFVDKDKFYCNDKSFSIQNPDFVKNLLTRVPLTKNVLSFLEKISSAIQMKENILIEYSEEDDPLFLQELVTGLSGNKVEFINLCKGIHTSDILGALKPEGNQVEWKDGPLTRAIRENSIIAITSLEASGAELVEKLNMLTDDAKAILLPPESNETEPLELKENSIVFAFKVFRKSKSTPTISRAFRNRFSTFLFPELDSTSEAKEIAFFHLGDERLSSFIAEFHNKIRGMAVRRVIGSANLSPYIYGTANLVRLCKHVVSYNKTIPLEELLLRAARIAYINQVYDPKERQDLEKTFLHGFKQGKFDSTIEDKIEEKKKTLTLSTDIEKKIWWDPELHQRDANTGKAKLKMTGNPLKQGIEINTPETGGKTKEGADAWYGEETRGNMGQGEPAGGGGAWGYRTEELYKQFLAKRRILWSYSTAVTKKEFFDVFGKELENTEMNLEKLFDPEIDITRVFQHEGKRIDARKYISFKSGKGDSKVFDKTIIDKKDEKLKGVEVVFLVSKARRIFNFDYSMVVVSALMSSSIILSDHEVAFSIYTYSDRFNRKDHIDLVRLKDLEEDYDIEKENEIFQALISDWQGDSVYEYQLLENAEKYFSHDASTRIIVMISDFRGQRGKNTIEQELDSFENRKLKSLITSNSNKAYVFLGVGMGNRFLAEEIFPNSIQITGENFSNMPNLLGIELSRLILTHHIG